MKNIERNIRFHLKHINYSVDLPQHLNSSLFFSSICFMIIGIYSFLNFFPYIQVLSNDIVMILEKDILIMFMHTAVFFLQVILILFTSGFALSLGLILGVAVIVSFFIDPSFTIFNIFFNFVIPLLALITLIKGHKGLSSEYLSDEWSY